MAMRAGPDSLRATKLKYAIGITLVLLILFAAVGTPRILSAFGRSSGGKTLVAEGASSGNSLKAEGSTGSGILQAKGDSSPGALRANDSHAVMPDDVRKWLEHLERIERKRGQLAMKQFAQALVDKSALAGGATMEILKGLLRDAETGGDSPEVETPAQSIKSKNETYKTEWTTLTDEFLAFPPPAECVPTRDKYNFVLSETKSMILEIMEKIDNSTKDPDAAVAELTAMLGTSTSRIDAPGGETDDLVSRICNKYETRKWFSISKDFGGGLTGAFGL